MLFAPRGYEVFENIEDIKALLQEQSEIYQEEADFYLLDSKTLCSRQDENDFKEISSLNIFNKNSNYISKIDIKQVYKVELCQKSQKEKLPFGIELISEQNTILNATLTSNINMKYYEGLKSDLYQELYRKMILDGYLVGIREYSQLDLQINAFISALKDNGIALQMTLKVAFGVPSVEGKNEKLEIYHEMQDEDNVGNLQTKFIPKVCLKAVYKGDLLLEYTKPYKGHIGRDLKGEFLPINPISSHSIQADLGITILEDSQHIKLVAKKDGFFKEIAPFCFIVDDALNTKKQEINHSLKILNIDLTHSHSKIEADIAYINSHKGNIKANVVVVDVLEKGVVEAKVAYVESMLGGKIIADYIYIKNVRSYNEVYFQYSLVVDNILGEHNLFECNGARFCYNKKDRLEYMMLKNQLQTHTKHLRKQMEETFNFLLTMQNKMHKIHKIYHQQTIPKNIQNFLNQYDHHLKNYQKLLEEYKDIINLNYHNDTILKKIDEMALKAKILICGEIGEAETMVRFKVYNQEREHVLKASLNKDNPAKLFEVIKKDDYPKLQTKDAYEETQRSWIEEFFPNENPDFSLQRLLS